MPLHRIWMRKQLEDCVIRLVWISTGSQCGFSPSWIRGGGGGGGAVVVAAMPFKSGRESAINNVKESIKLLSISYFASLLAKINTSSYSGNHPYVELVLPYH